MISLMISEIMSGDKQLANEIEFDLRRFEEQQIELEKQKQQKQAQQQVKHASLMYIKICDQGLTLLVVSGAFAPGF